MGDIEYAYAVQHDNGHIPLKDTRENCEEFIRNRPTLPLHLVRRPLSIIWERVEEMESLIAV
jgi:hypothetical protein